MTFTLCRLTDLAALMSYPILLNSRAYLPTDPNPPKKGMKRTGRAARLTPSIAGEGGVLSLQLRKMYTGTEEG